MAGKRPVYSTDQGRLCPDCAAPVAVCICRQQTSIPAGDGIIRLQRQVKGRAGKPVVLVTGLPLNPGDLKSLAKKLKTRCGVGGSVDGNNIVIQGDKRDLLKQELENMGYKVKLSGG